MGKYHDDDSFDLHTRDDKQDNKFYKGGDNESKYVNESVISIGSKKNRY